MHKNFCISPTVLVLLSWERVNFILRHLFLTHLTEFELSFHIYFNHILKVSTSIATNHKLKKKKKPFYILFTERQQMKHVSSFPKSCKRFSINFTEDIQFQVYNRKASECPDTASLTQQLKNRKTE